MSTKQKNSQDNLEPEALSQDAKDQDAASQAVEDALATPAASGSGTIKVNG
jgi:hypothetical protein